jgi:hypothetical protein
MHDIELDVLIERLETRNDLTVGDLSAVALALSHLRPDVVTDPAAMARLLDHTDGAMHVADLAYPNWSVAVHGRANDRDGHWRCTVREGDVSDNDHVIGTGRSPVLSQAVLAAVLRLANLTRSDRERATPETQAGP